MDNAILKFENGYIIFDDFEKIVSKQFITFKIFGKKKHVAVSLSIPSTEILPFYNVIYVVNHKCYNPGLISKLMDAGINSGEHFLFFDNAYYPLMA